MSRSLLSIILVAAFSACVASTANARGMAETEIVDNSDFAKVVISVNESVLRVSGAAGQVMCIYNVAGGAPVMKVRVDGPDKRFDLNLPKGIYIVQVGKAVRKIILK